MLTSIHDFGRKILEGHPQKENASRLFEIAGTFKYISGLIEESA